MSLITENVIPYTKGKIFKTNAETEAQMNAVKRHVEELEGVKEVKIINDTFPREFLVRADHLVEVEQIQEKTNEVSINAIPKGWFDF